MTVKNFDEARRAKHKAEGERTFVLGDETFVLRPAIHPSILERYDDLDNDTPVKETMEIVDDLIVALIEPRDGAEDRYRAVRANQDDPISVEDLQDLIRWMMEIQTGRPTGPPGDSSPGETSAVTSLMGGSFSQDPDGS